MTDDCPKYKSSNWLLERIHLDPAVSQQRTSFLAGIEGGEKGGCGPGRPKPADPARMICECVQRNSSWITGVSKQPILEQPKIWEATCNR
jgi:hypothetical protein